jgi:DNA-binding MarR family transcriptional regulator
MTRLRRSVPVDDYVLDVLLRDLVGHDKQPAAFLVYLHLHVAAARLRWRPVAASLRDIAEATGLSKSAAQTAMKVLQRRQLIVTQMRFRTATARHRVVRHWVASRRRPRRPFVRLSND